MCERGVVNRLISEGAEEAYLDRLSKGQQVCLGEMEDLASRCDVHLTEVPLFDTELCAGLWAARDGLRPVLWRVIGGSQHHHGLGVGLGGHLDHARVCHARSLD